MMPKIFLFSACVLLGGSLADDEQNTTIDKHPYEVSVQRYGRYEMCAGSIISLKVVLTAGSCVYREPKKSLSVRAGSTVIGFEGQVRQVKKAILHPKYDPRTKDYDVAILQLDSQLTSSDTVSAIKVIKTSKDLHIGTEGTVSGWGMWPVDSSLKEEAVLVVPNEECSRLHGEGTVTSRMLCAGPPAKLLSEANPRCLSHSDAGGPLVADGELLGVVSWGTGCPRPAVFAKLSDSEIGSFIKRNS